MFVLSSPLKVETSKKKSFILNMNNYRNAHYAVLSKSKVIYKEEMTEQVSALPKIEKPIHIHYIYYAATKRRSDIDNVVSVHKKYFQDVLVDLEIIEDDTYNHIVSSSESFGGIDRENPRVDIHIFESENNLFDSINSLLNK